MSARLYAHVPARSEAYSSRYRRRERFALVVTLSSLDLQSQIAFSHVVHNQLRTINEPEPWKIYLLLKDLARANRVSPHRTATQTDSRQTGPAGETPFDPPYRTRHGVSGVKGWPQEKIITRKDPSHSFGMTLSLFLSFRAEREIFRATRHPTSGLPLEPNADLFAPLL